MPTTMHKATQGGRERSKSDISGRRGRGSLVADGVQPVLQGHPVEAGERQAEEEPYAVLQRGIGLTKRTTALDFATLDGSGIGDAPMRRHRLAGPRGASLARGAV